jgi:hypothetical protein
MTHDIDDEIARATDLGRSLEQLVVNKGSLTVRSDRDGLLIAYWSLICEYNKGILCLLHYKFYAPAFALLRPIVETVVRCHVAKFGSEDEVRRLRNDQYTVNYEKDGARIDKAVGTGSLLETYLKTARPLLHSFTHSGKAQLSRRFLGNDVEQSFCAPEIVSLIANCASAVFMITVLITRHFDFSQEWEAAQKIWLQYGERQKAPSKLPTEEGHSV